MSLRFAFACSRRLTPNEIAARRPMLMLLVFRNLLRRDLSWRVSDHRHRVRFTTNRREKPRSRVRACLLVQDMPSRIRVCLLVSGHTFLCQDMPSRIGVCLLVSGHTFSYQDMPSRIGVCLQAYRNFDKKWVRL